MTPQDRIVALEKRVANQRPMLRELSGEIIRYRAFIQWIGYDPDDLKFEDRQRTNASVRKLHAR